MGLYMETELDNYFSELKKTIPVAIDKNDNSIDIKRSMFLKIPQKMTSKNIIITKGFADYNSYYRIDRLIFFTQKATLKSLGLLIFYSIFKSNKTITLKLINEHSEIKNIKIDPYNSNSIDIYDNRKFSVEINCNLNYFSYRPQILHRYPWFYFQDSVFDLPTFFLTNFQECIASETDYKKRDTIVISCSIKGMLRLGTLLLDLSNIHQKQNEYYLECEYGYKGVAPGSAEVKFCLPGSDGWKKSYF